MTLFICDCVFFNFQIQKIFTNHDELLDNEDFTSDWHHHKDMLIMKLSNDIDKVQDL